MKCVDISPEDKSSIEEALANHGAKAREQRNWQLKSGEVIYQ